MNVFGESSLKKLSMLLKNKLYSELSGYSKSSHTHDDRYYTESEINTKLNGKANSDHSHNYVAQSGQATNDSSGNHISTQFEKLSIDTYGSSSSSSTTRKGIQCIDYTLLDEAGYYLAIGCVRFDCVKSDSLTNLYLSNSKNINGDENYLAANGVINILNAMHLQVVGFFHISSNTYIKLNMFCSDVLNIAQSDLQIIRLRKD